MRRTASFLLLAFLIVVSSALIGCTREMDTQAEDAQIQEASLEISEESDAMSSENTYRNEDMSSENTYKYEIQGLSARRGENQIYGVIYIPQGTEEKMPAVIFSHGFGGNHSVGTQYAEALAEHGYVVYCFDFCGGSSGSRSDGSTLEMSVFTEQADLEAVIAMIQELEYVDSENLFLIHNALNWKWYKNIGKGKYPLRSAYQGAGKKKPCVDHRLCADLSRGHLVIHGIGHAQSPDSS